MSGSSVALTSQLFMSGTSVAQNTYSTMSESTVPCLGHLLLRLPTAHSSMSGTIVPQTAHLFLSGTTIYILNIRCCCIRK